MGFKWNLLVLLALLGGKAFGQNEGLKYRNYSLREGLSQSTVLSIFQDKKGFLWFATSDGLNQFDGYKFKVYKNNYLNTNSLSDSWVELIFQGSDDELWLVTADRVMNKLNLRTDEITRFIPGKPDSDGFEPFNKLFYIFEDQQKNLWISTDLGLYRCVKPLQKVVSYRKDPTSPVHIDGNLVFYIFQDSNHSLWFATWHGLFRYRSNTDSFDRFAYQHGTKGSILSDTVIKVVEDKNRNLWVLTPKGLNLFQPKTNHFVSYPFPKQVHYDMKLMFFSSIADKNGFLWIGTSGGVLRFDTKTNRYAFYRQSQKEKGGLSDDRVTRIVEDKSGNIWIGTANGLNKYNPSTNNFDNYYCDKGYASIITAIAEDKNGSVWALGGIELPKGAILSYLNTETGQLEVQVNDKCNPNSISSTYLSNMFIDRAKGLWLGTFGNGVLQYVPRSKKFEYYPPMPGNSNFLGGNSIWGFAEDEDGNIWIPLFDRGLDKFNPKNKQFTHFRYDKNKTNGLPPNNILTITPGRGGDLWMSTNGAGILLYNTRTGKFRQYKNQPGNPYSIASNFMRKIVVDPQGKLWVGYSNMGIDYFDPVTEKAIHYVNDPKNKNSLANNNIWSLCQDKTGEIWISSEGYIDRFNQTTRQFVHYKSKSIDSTGIIADKALCIYEDSKGRIWFGTSGGGLSLFNRSNNKFSHWTENDGLPNNVVYGILEDEKGCLWLSTNKGLSRFNTYNGKFTNYDENDGLQSNEFNMGSCLKSSDNKLYFGGINGFNAFYPGKIQQDTVTYNTVITGIQVFNKELQVIPPGRRYLIDKGSTDQVVRDENAIYLPQNITYAEGVTLTHHEKVFTLEFSALSFENPEKTAYKYIMENFDTDWNYSGNRRFATYTNLPAGNYIFKVTAANADGVWNPKPTLLHIRILPPFWQTWWFMLCEGGFIFCMIMLAMRIRVRRLKHAKAELEQKVDERTHEIREKNEELELRNLQILKQKEEIAFQAQQLKTELVSQNQTSELALLRTQVNPHFLFNTLNNIYSLVYQRSNEAPEAVMKLSEIMRYMLYEATSEKVLLQNEVNYLKSFIELQLLRIKNRDFVSFNISGNINGRTISPMLLISFVENAFKHGVKRGINPGIIINLDVNSNKIIFEVINYCQTNAPMNKDKTGGIGLTNIKRRLELLHSNKFVLDIQNSEDVYHVKLELEE